MELHSEQQYVMEIAKTLGVGVKLRQYPNSDQFMSRTGRITAKAWAWTRLEKRKNS